MKKGLMIFLITISLLIGNSSVFADRDVPTITGYSSNTLIKIGDGKVYAIDFIATSAGGGFALIDATDGLISTTNVMIEGTEATQANSRHYDFSNKPLEFSTGVYLLVNKAQVVLSYE